MDGRRTLWALVRAWAVLVAAGLVAAGVLALRALDVIGPTVGIYVAVGGFIVTALGMLVLVQVTRESALRRRY